MKQFVVYTVQTGGYDSVQQPLEIDERFDYVLFSDAVTEPKKGVWDVRPIPYDNADLTRLSRYPKMHPNKMLSEYSASLYIDANVQIIGQRIYDRVVECYELGIDWAGIQHPFRDCIYDEAYVIYGLDTEANIFRWCHRLRQEGYSRHRGLNENNIIFRTHNDRVKEVDAMWWSLYETYTRRDQLTLYYVLWKNPELKTDLLLPSGESSLNSDTVTVMKHQKSSKKAGRRGVKESFWEHARNRCRNGMAEKAEVFREFHYWLYGLNPVVAKVLLHLWGIYATVVYGTIIKFRAYRRHKNER